MIEVEGVDFVRVPVRDIEKAKDFYGRVLGLSHGPSVLDDWVEYQAGNLTLAVMTPESHGYEFAPLPPGTIGLRVPDVVQAKAELEAAGIEVRDVFDTGVCRGASFRDPDGNAIVLHNRYAPHEERTEP